MTRRLTSLLLLAICLVAIGVFLFRLDEEYFYIGHPTIYEFVGALGMFVLFIAMLVMTAVYGRISFTLTPSKVLALGLATWVPIPAVMWVMNGYLNTHSWTLSLLALPLIALLSGGTAIVIGLFRMFKKYMEAQYRS